MSQELDSVNGSQPGAMPDRRRRRFLGAGASVTPAILTLASQPALGVTCFTPSRSLSRNTSVSQTGQYGECTGAESPGNYKAQQDSTATAYHWPASVPPSTLFHDLFFQGTRVGTVFLKPVSAGHISMSLGEVLNSTGNEDPGKVAFHIIGAYLNVNGGNGAVIPPQVATSATIQQIWREYASSGFYEPVAGVKWYSTEIVDYLKSNGLVA